MPSHDGRPWLGNMSLRVRMTIWVIVVVVLIQGALATVAFLYQRQSARRALDRALSRRVAMLLPHVQVPPEQDRLR